MKNLKTKKIYILIAVILLVIIAIAIAKRLTTKKAPIIYTEDIDNSSSSNSFQTTDAEFPLKLTSPMKRGNNVRQLQNWLNKKLPGIYKKIDVDGIFGAKTENALYIVTNKKEITQLEFFSLGISNESIL